MTISIVAAMARNRVIGRANGIPWRLSTDLKRLKSLTIGHPVIMGRKTFESLPCPLPGRTNIVVTRDTGWQAPAGVLVVPSVEGALALAAGVNEGAEEVFILGGAQIYAQILDRVDRMYLTEVHADVEGDAVFPEFDEAVDWKLVDREDFEADAKNEYPFSFLLYERNAHRERMPAESG
jgi:dihydrofolate reductase